MTNNQEGLRRISWVLRAIAWLGIAFTVIHPAYVAIMYGFEYVDAGVLVFPVVSGGIFGLAYILDGFNKPG